MLEVIHGTFAVTFQTFTSAWEVLVVFDYTTVNGGQFTQL